MFLGQTSYQKWKVNEPGVFYLLFYVQCSEKGNTENKMVLELCKQSRSRCVTSNTR